MFLEVGDKIAAVKSGKYESVKDDCEKLVDDEGSEVETRRGIFSRRDIVHSILIGAAFFAFAWITMSMSRNQDSSLADVEDQIAHATLSTVNTTKTILAQVEEKSSTLKSNHQLIAANFIDTVTKDLTEKTNVIIQNIDQMIQETMLEIYKEMDIFEKGVSEGFDGFVAQAINRLEKIQNSVNAENDDNVITNLTVQAADTITMLLKDTEQMYSFYSRYLTTVLENKLQNTTDRVSKLLLSQRRFVAANNIDRINLCYNVCTQNTKMSRLLKSILDSMSAIGQTMDTINGLKSIHQTQSEHAELVDKSKSDLAETMESDRLALQQLLKDDLCYLGTAVRKMAQQRHASFKRTLLANLTATVESLAPKWDAATSNFKVIRSDQRLQMAKDLLNAVQSMMDAINAKARRHGKNEELENLIVVKSSVMEKFDEMTERINSIFKTSQTYTSESLHNYLKFTIDRQLAGLSSLSVQNFIPDDLCPLAMNYQAFITFTLNTAMGSQVPDVIDELFASSAIPDNSSQEVGNVESADDTGIIMVVAMDEEETDTSGESALQKVIDNLTGVENSIESDEFKSVEDFIGEKTNANSHEIENPNVSTTKPRKGAIQD